MRHPACTEILSQFQIWSAQIRPNFGPMYSTFHLTIGPWVVGFYISQERCFSFACFVAVVAWRWLPDVVGCIELMFWSKSIQCSQHSSSLLLAKLAGYGDVHNWRQPVLFIPIESSSLWGVSSAPFLFYFPNMFHGQKTKPRLKILG